MPACPICRFQPASVTPRPGYPLVDCARCGVFSLVGPAFDLPSEWIAGRDPERKPNGRFAASHAIRRMQAKGAAPEIKPTTLATMWTQPFPNPQRQADLLVLFLGDANGPIDQYVHCRVEQFCAEVGTQDDPVTGKTGGFNLITKRLLEQRIIEMDPAPPGPNVGIRLTFDGWSRYEQLRRDVTESRTAFMAMSFSNSDLTKIVTDHFVPAVRETGFDLYRLDDRPKAGLIDNRMRVEIRVSKFLICDLTDENRGAYWEAGFAEGAQKPVFYTCERAKFSGARTHFDTEHLFTILWDVSKPELAAEELKAVIRREFPADATPPSLSRS